MPGGPRCNSGVRPILPITGAAQFHIKLPLTMRRILTSMSLEQHTSMGEIVRNAIRSYEPYTKMAVGYPEEEPINAMASGPPKEDFRWWLRRNPEDAEVEQHPISGPNDSSPITIGE